MSDQGKERYDDNGWRRWLRDWGVAATFVAIVFWGGVSYNAIAENTKSREATKTELQEVTKALQAQAEINGRVSESVETLKDTVKTLVDLQLGAPARKNK